MKKLLSWQSVSFLKYHRDKKWYFALGGLLCLMVLIAIFMGSPWFAIALILFAMAYVYSEQADPKMIEIALTELGITFGKQSLNWTDLKTFWIDYNPPAVAALHLVRNDRLSSEVTVYFYGVDPTEIRSVLTVYLPEWTDRKKNTSEHLTGILGL